MKFTVFPAVLLALCASAWAGDVSGNISIAKPAEAVVLIESAPAPGKPARTHLQFAHPQKNGKFKLAHVPAGEYIIKACSQFKPVAGPRSIKVPVSGGVVVNF